MAQMKEPGNDDASHECKHNDEDDDQLQEQTSTWLERTNAQINKDNRKVIKILFLDIDGVLNGSIEFDLFNNAPDARTFSLYHMELLKLVLVTTDCKIVLSTAWRRSQDGVDRIKKQCIEDGINWNELYLGNTPVVPFKDYQGMGPGYNDYPRPFEIQLYLKTLKDENKYVVESWCAVDDMDLASGDKSKQIMKGHFVKTDGCKGITEDDALKIIRILNE
eukprot:100247_1